VRISFSLVPITKLIYLNMIVFDSIYIGKVGTIILDMIIQSQTAW
jgi:hypothetical protein